jgi:hypothetical protein
LDLELLFLLKFLNQRLECLWRLPIGHHFHAMRAPR